MKRFFVSLVVVCGLCVSAFAEWRYVCKSDSAEQFMNEYAVYKLYDNGNIEYELPICHYNKNTNENECELDILVNSYYESGSDEYKKAFKELLSNLKDVWAREKQKVIDSGECKLIEL